MLQEIIDHIEFFRKSGKPTVAYLERGAQLEYLLACACEEVYVPPSSLIFLTGYCFASGHVRGVLDKLGIEPSVRLHNPLFTLHSSQSMHSDSQLPFAGVDMRY